MTGAPALVRDRALPQRFAVLNGLAHAGLVGSAALLAAGQGIAAWALMTAAGWATVTANLHWRRHVDGRPLGTSAGAVAVAVATVALVLGGGLLARTVVGDVPWAAVVLALAVGAATGSLLRWWQLRPVLSPV